MSSSTSQPEYSLQANDVFQLQDLITFFNASSIEMSKDIEAYNLDADLKDASPNAIISEACGVKEGESPIIDQYFSTTIPIYSKDGFGDHDVVKKSWERSKTEFQTAKELLTPTLQNVIAMQFLKMLATPIFELLEKPEEYSQICKHKHSSLEELGYTEGDLAQKYESSKQVFGEPIPGRLVTNLELCQALCTLTTVHFKMLVKKTKDFEQTLITTNSQSQILSFDCMDCSSTLKSASYHLTKLSCLMYTQCHEQVPDQLEGYSIPPTTIEVFKEKESQ